MIVSSTSLPAREPLHTPLIELAGVTATMLERLDRLGLRTVGDLLFHLPRAYEDLTDQRSIANLIAGTVQTVQGEIVEMDTRTLNDGRFVVSVVISDDGTHVVEGVWFNQSHVTRRFRYGQRVSFSGKPKWFRDHWQIGNPRVQIVDGSEPANLSVVPVYSLTEDLRPEQLRKLIGKALDLYSEHIVEILPESLRRTHKWPVAAQALREAHFPPILADAQRARRRFIYEEFLILQLALALRRRDARDGRRAPSLVANAAVDAHIRRLLPFQLTNDQNQAVREICRDLASERPMQRLLQADVGAGKTAVAVYALLAAVANKHQAAIMAPTEVLARQHWQTLEQYLARSRVRRLLLIGGLTPKERRAALEAIRTGAVDLVVGTQALVQEDVQLAQLGLVVIDDGSTSSACISGRGCASSASIRTISS